MDLRKYFPKIGSSGKEPADGKSWEPGDEYSAYHVTWLWDKVRKALGDVEDQLNTIDSDDDGVVDEADYAQDADASAYKGNDIDSNGDGTVDLADVAHDIEAGSGDITVTTDGSGSGGFIITDAANNTDLFKVTEGGNVEVLNTSLLEQGNRVATRNWATTDNIAVGDLANVTGEGSGGGLNADQVDGKDAGDLGVAVEDDGTTVYNPSTGINFGTGINVADDNDGTVTATAASKLSQLTIDANKDWGNYDITNVRKLSAEDGSIVGKTLESSNSLTIGSDESMVVADEYTVNGTLTVEGDGTMKVV